MTSPFRSAANLSALARALGGDLQAGGRRALAPAPGHSPDDRSVSLLLEDGRLIVHSFGAADWRDVLDDLRARGWIDADNRLLEGGVPVGAAGPSRPEPTRHARIAAARRLWDAGGPVADASPAARYIAGRGVDLRLASALRAHAAASTFVYRDSGPRRPALLAPVRDAEGKLTAVEITYLDHQGRKSREARPARKVIGALPAGSAVRLAPRADAMVVGEGVFTTLSAMRRFALPGWALLSTSNLRRWSAPNHVQRVLIAADRGPDGERSAATLRAALCARGCVADLVLPPAGYGDWNDLDQEEAKEGRIGASGP